MVFTNDTVHRTFSSPLKGPLNHHRSDNSCAIYIGHLYVSLTALFRSMSVAHDMADINSTGVVRMRGYGSRRIHNEQSRDNRGSYEVEV